MSFIQAGNEAVRAALKARIAAERNKPKYDRFGKRAIEDQTAQDLLSMEIRGRAQEAALISKSNKKTKDINREAEAFAKEQERSARMAGKLAGGAALIGSAYFTGKQKFEEDPSIAILQQHRESVQSDITSREEEMRETQKKIDDFKAKQSTEPLSGSYPTPPSKETLSGSFPAPKSLQSRDGDGSISLSMDSIYKMAQKSGAKFPELVAAQWALESGYGSSPSGKNNYFGIKATSSEAGTSKNTWEVYDGKKVNTSARFKDFESPQASVDDLVSKWHKDYKNYKGVNNASDAVTAAQMLVSEKYATDPAYAQKLVRIMKENDYL
jgi:flagellum-specific peptidoglycan hydrolase FlgJ